MSDAMEQRDWRIADDYTAGESLRAIAKREGISMQRVHQIVKNLGVPTRSRRNPVAVEVRKLNEAHAREVEDLMRQLTDAREWFNAMTDARDEALNDAARHRSYLQQIAEGPLNGETFRQFRNRTRDLAQEGLLTWAEVDARRQAFSAAMEHAESTLASKRTEVDKKWDDCDDGPPAQDDADELFDEIEASLNGPAVFYGRDDD